MYYRRDLQVALTTYARHHSMDIVQTNILRVIRLVEMACWRSYFKYRFKQLLRTTPNVSKANFRALKKIVKAEWESVCKQRGY